MRAFQLVDARSAGEAVDLLRRHGERARLVASGADLLDLMKDFVEGPALASPEILINLAAVEGLEGVREERSGGLVVGAMTRLADLADHPVVGSRFGVLRQAASRIASPQLRNTSTVAGNLCQRPRCWYFRSPDVVCLKKGGGACWAVEGENRWYHAILEGGPCHIVHPSDLAPALASLDAVMRILGPEGERSVPIEEFFLTTSEGLYRENVLAPDEMIREIVIPRPRRPFQIFLKSTVRGAGEFALVSVAVTAAAAGGACEDCRIVLGGVSPRPFRAAASERILRGMNLAPRAFSAAADAAVSGARPMSMNAYKVDLARRLVGRALETVFTEAPPQG